MNTAQAVAVAGRVAALELPGLPYQVFRRDRPGLAGQPVVVVEGAAGREKVCAVSPEAREAGIEPGRGLAEARAFAPSVVVLVREVRREVEALVRLAEALLGLAPFVELAPPEALLLDASAAPLVPPGTSDRPGTQGNTADSAGEGAARAHELAWGRLVVEAAEAQGLSARLALADTPEAARLLVATAEVPVRVVPSGRARGLLSGVPLGLIARLCDDLHRFQAALDKWSAGPDPQSPSSVQAPSAEGPAVQRRLGVDADELAQASTRLLPPLDVASFEFVRGLGLRRLGDLATLPARALGHRLGRDGTRLLGFASGGHARPLTAFWPELPLLERLDLESGVADASALQFAVRPLVERLGVRLERRGLAATRLRLTLELEAAYRPVLPFAGPGVTFAHVASKETGQDRGGPVGETDGPKETDDEKAVKSSGFGRPRRRSITLPIELARPAVAAATLVSVVRERLAAFPVTAPVVACLVEVVEHTTRGAQLGLGQRPRALDALESTLARLTARLGEPSVGALRPVPVWEPEKTRTRVPFKPDLGRSLLDAPARAADRPAHRPAPRHAPDTPDAPRRLAPPPDAGLAWRRLHTRPTRLFVPEPVSVDWDALGRPVAVTWRTHRTRVVDWTPPERLWAGWWRVDVPDEPDEPETDGADGRDEIEAADPPRDSHDAGPDGSKATPAPSPAAPPPSIDEPLARNAHGDPEKPKKQLEPTRTGPTADRPSGHDAARDYATWLLDDGVRLWLFRDASARWWAHGVFD